MVGIRVTGTAQDLNLGFQRALSTTPEDARANTQRINGIGIVREYDDNGVRRSELPPPSFWQRLRLHTLERYDGPHFGATDGSTAATAVAGDHQANALTVDV